jgi:drug/metabolite transporter (DMT)-like permease
MVTAGALGMTLHQVFLNIGEETVQAGTASLLVATAPVIALILARDADSPPSNDDAARP